MTILFFINLSRYLVNYFNRMVIDNLEELLLAISYKNEKCDDAEAAFNKLYWEYSKFLYSVVRKNLYNIGVRDEDILVTIVNNTFVKIYENPLMFSVPENESDKTDNSFKAWISRIAKNELLDLIKEFKNKEILSTDTSIEPAFDEMLLDIENENINLEGINIKILNDALSTLSERDRDIVRALYMYHEKGKNTPSEVLNELCNFFGTTKDNIRQVKVRAEKRIIEYFSKRTELKPIKYAKG